MKHRSYEYRAVVDFAATDDVLASRFAALLTRAPSDRIEVVGAHAVTYREEPPWYFTVTYGATQGMAILTHIASTRTNHWFAATALAVLLDVFAVYCLARLVFALAWRLEIEVSPGSVDLRERIWSRTLRVKTLSVHDLAAVLVVGASGKRRAVIVGARNEECAVLFRERFLDPPALPRWMADLFAVLASGAAAGWVSSKTANATSVPPSALSDTARRP